MLRRLHLCEMKKTSSNVVEGNCYLMNDFIDQNGILYGTGCFCCDYCCIPIHEKFILVGLEMIICFVVMNV